MSNWITLSPTDLHPYLQAAQVDALREEALAPGQADPVVAVLADVVERIRASVRASPANRLSQTAGSIPPELRGVAAMLAIESAQTRLPALALTADQVRAANNARKFLDHVRVGLIAVTTPSDPVPVAEAAPASSGRIELVARRERPLSGSTLAGL